MKLVCLHAAIQTQEERTDLNGLGKHILLCSIDGTAFLFSPKVHLLGTNCHLYIKYAPSSHQLTICVSSFLFIFFTTGRTITSCGIVHRGEFFTHFRRHGRTESDGSQKGENSSVLATALVKNVCAQGVDECMINVHYYY